MAGSFTTVDLSQLAAPDVVEALSFETIFAAMLADLKDRDSSFTALVESDPAYKILQVAAYRELLIRQRVNDAAKSIMLAFATGADLDQVGANKGVQRLVITPEDTSTIPPTPAVYEGDDDFRRRIQLSPEGYTTAGSEGSYVFHALSASGQVKDAQAVSELPGYVTVYVLARAGTGEASTELVDTVEAALNAQRIRPMTDNVSVLPAAITSYDIEAELVMYPGPDAEVVRQAAQTAVTAYAEAMRRIGYDVTPSGLHAALHQPGVQRVNLTSPASGVSIGDGEASYCESITVTVASATNV